MEYQRLEPVYLSSTSCVYNICVYVLRNFRFAGFELRGFILPGRHSNPSGRKRQALTRL